MKKNAGFSMIEVLVASSILVIIVMMMGMLFQQGSSAWRVGAKRSDGFMKVRTFLGALERDISQAVDVNALIAARRAPTYGNGSGGNKDPINLNKNNQKFSGKELKFLTFSNPTNRLSWVTYDLGSFTREEKVLIPENNSWKTLSSRKKLIDTSANGASLPQFGSVTAVWDDGNGNPTTTEKEWLPMYIKFDATFESADTALDIGAESAGPDGRFDTDDDIRTWSED